MILTKPTVTKGTPAQFSLNKANLAQLPSVLSDSYYSDISNWSSVKLEYRSAISEQVESVVFKMFPNQTVFTADFSLSTHARGDFEINNITIYDFDNGRFHIQRSELNTSEFDVVFGGTAPTGNTTAYRYIKLKMLESFAGGSMTLSPGSTLGSSVSIDELKLKYDGAVQSLASIPVQGFSPALGLFSANIIHDGVTHTDNSGFGNWQSSWVPEFTVDLSVSKVVTDVLIAPQGNTSSGAEAVYNMPKKFEVFGSNDGTTFTSIKVIDQTTWTYGTALGQWQAGNFTNFSI